MKADEVPCFGFSIKWNNSQFWRPSLEFSNPICDGRVWNNDKHWRNFELYVDVSKEGRNLNRFSLFPNVSSGIYQRSDELILDPCHQPKCMVGVSTSF